MPDIDPLRVRQRFTRHSSERADFILREVSARMFERLDYIKLAPAAVLDAGCGALADARELARRFPAARTLGVDLVGPRTAAASIPGRDGGWLGGLLGGLRKPGRPAGPMFVRADCGTLPLATDSLDLVWSNLVLHWHPAPHRVMPEWRRVLRTGGLVMFSAFGPDTLKEVRAACAAAWPGSGNAHVADFTDMHDYGDMLVAAGFADPVMDVERLTLTYADAASLWRDVRALGGNAASGRSRGLTGRAARARLDAALDATRDAAGRHCLSFEIVYGHAWGAVPRRNAAGEAMVRVADIGRGRAPGRGE